MHLAGWFHSYATNFPETLMLYLYMVILMKLYNAKVHGLGDPELIVNTYSALHESEASIHNYC